MSIFPTSSPRLSPHEPANSERNAAYSQQRKVQNDRSVVLLTFECYSRPASAATVVAHEGFCEDLARQTTVTHLSQLQLGLRYCHIWVSVFSTRAWRPKGQYLGRCTVCLGVSAHRPCFDLSVCLQPVCLSPDKPIRLPALLFPASPSLS